MSIPPSAEGEGFELAVVAALGYGNNNEGEMHGVAIALDIATIVRHTLTFTTTPPVLALSDSFGSLGYITLGWRCVGVRTTARLARRDFHALERDGTARMYWVRGHSGINQAVAGCASGGVLGAMMGGPQSAAFYCVLFGTLQGAASIGMRDQEH